MASLRENGVLHIDPGDEEFPPASFPLALDGRHSLRGDDPRSALGAPRHPLLGSAEHRVFEDVLGTLLA